MAITAVLIQQASTLLPASPTLPWNWNKCIKYDMGSSDLLAGAERAGFSFPHLAGRGGGEVYLAPAPGGQHLLAFLLPEAKKGKA